MADHEGRLAGQIAIVTGGSAGYGLGTVRRLVAEGATVYATARGRGRLEAAVSDLPNVHPMVADVTSAEDWERLVTAVTDSTGRIDILVNNAGAGIRVAPLDEQSVTDIEMSVAVNLVGPMLGCRAVAPRMKARGRGTIINVLSICCRQAWGGWSVYSAAKAGLEQFTRCLHVELRPHGVRVTSLIPSWGNTSFAEALGRPPLEEERARLATQPEEFGRVVTEICALPPHLTVLDLTLLPLVQEIEPL